MIYRSSKGATKTMRIMSTRLFAAAFVLSSVATASAQTADEIVDKTLTAIGGRAALGKLTSRSVNRDD